jgi:rhamnosyltransferase
VIESKDICAIIVSYNIGKRINECVNSILNQVNEIVIVDNGSNSETVDELKKLELHNKIRVIYNKDNYGIAKALNTGVRYAIQKKYVWVLTLDHDSIASKDMISKMAKTYCLISYKDNIGVICSNVYDINKCGYIIENDSLHNDFRELKVAIQSGSLIKTSVFKKIGFFNEELFIYYVDVEFSVRLRNSRFKIIQSIPAILYHEEGKKVKKKLFSKEYYYDNYSELAIYYIARNSIYMIKNYKENKKSYIRRLLIDFKQIVLFDTYRFRKIRYYIWGIYNGMVGVYGRFEGG